MAPKPVGPASTMSSVHLFVSKYAITGAELKAVVSGSHWNLAFLLSLFSTIWSFGARFLLF
jgi:hypothetical protein